MCCAVLSCAALRCDVMCMTGPQALELCSLMRRQDAQRILLKRLVSGRTGASRDLPYRHYGIVRDGHAGMYTKVGVQTM